MITLQIPIMKMPVQEFLLLLVMMPCAVTAYEQCGLLLSVKLLENAVVFEAKHQVNDSDNTSRDYSSMYHAHILTTDNIQNALVSILEMGNSSE
jgi:hypothetical protein